MAAPYDTVITVLNTAAARLNDAMQTPATAVSGQIGGEVVGPQQIFSQEVVNQAWRHFQDDLIAADFDRFTNTAILSGITPVATSDAGVSCYINFNGYYDGSTVNGSPVLPQDLRRPLRVWERQNGLTGQSSAFVPMECVQDGFTNFAKTTRNYQWEWKQDSIFFPGSTNTMDLQVRYQAYLGDFLTVGGTMWYNQPVPILQAKNPLSLYICWEYGVSRGDMETATWETKAKEALAGFIQQDKTAADLRQQWVIPDIPAATGATPYDVASTILNTVKVRMNNAAKQAGDIIVTAQPFMQQVFNTAYRKLQDFLFNLGFYTLTDTVVLLSMGPTQATDVSTETYLSWSGYFDGSVVNASPVLPQNLLAPLRIEERINGQDALFIPMEQMIDGLPVIPIQTYNRLWEWRADAIYFPGSNQTLDVRIRYAKYLPDLTNAFGPWYLQQVLIPRCQDALSLFCCAEIAAARPDLDIDPDEFLAKAEVAAGKIFNRDVKMKNRTNARRKSRSGRLETWNGSSYSGSLQW